MSKSRIFVVFLFVVGFLYLVLVIVDSPTGKEMYHIRPGQVLDFLLSNTKGYRPISGNNSSFEIDKVIKQKAILEKLHSHLHTLHESVNSIYNSCENCTVPGDIPIPENIQEHMLFYEGSEFFNPNYHFGELTVKPIGIPDSVAAENRGNYRIYKTSSPAIHHFLVQPKQQKQTSPGVKYNEISPCVAISKNVFSPFRSENSLFSYDAFWALIETDNTLTAAGQVVKSFWTQRLLWEIGENVAILLPDYKKAANYSILQNDTVPQTTVDFNTLAKTLRNWTCERSVSFSKCAIRLSEDLEETGFWVKSDVLAIKAWFKDLVTVKYREPRRKFETNNVKTKITNIVYDNDYRDVVYYPVSSKISDQDRRTEQLKDIRKMCKNNSFHFQSDLSKFKPMTSTLLIITFNSPYYYNIPIIEMYYKGLFKHRVYCGQFFYKFQETAKKMGFKVNFVEFPVQHAGAHMHMCISAAMRLNYNVDNYIILGDDVLFNWWNVLNFPRDKFWFTTLYNLHRKVRTRAWDWWQLEIGQEAYNNFWDDMMTIRSKNNTFAPMIDSFVSTMKQNTGSEFGTVHALSDVVFIPGKFKKQALYFLDILYRNKVFSELATPNIVAGLSLKKDIHFLRSKFLWGGERSKAPQLFDKKDVFMHAVKLSAFNKLQPFFCGKYFTNYL